MLPKAKTPAKMLGFFAARKSWAFRGRMEVCVVLVVCKLFVVRQQRLALGSKKMSLNWNATKVIGWDDFDAEDRNLCGNLAWLLMAIAVGDVKADNVGEIAFRLRVLRGIHGPLLTGYKREDGTERTAAELADKYESVEFLVRMVGYHTNVTDETWSVWSRRVHNVNAGELQGKAKQLLEVVPA